MKIEFAGEEFLLHPSGALIWPSRQTLIVADAHLEKGSFFARWGFHLPPYDSHLTLKLILETSEKNNVRKILILGDFFHDNFSYQRLSQEALALFNMLKKFTIIWIKGNHDVGYQPEGVEARNEYTEAGIVFRHEAVKNDSPEISGHFHPKSKFIHKGGSINGRCFIEDGEKFILPAFGAYTGGLSIENKAIKILFSEDMRSYIIINESVIALPRKKS